MDDETNRLCDMLMLDLARGDRSVFPRLCDTTLATILGCAGDVMKTRDEATLLDVAQDVFMFIMRTAPNYRTDRGARFETWLRMIVTGRAIDVLRARGRRKARSFTSGEEHAAPEPVDTFMINDAAEKALSVLDDEDRLVFVLRARDELGYDEIAQILGKSKTAEGCKKQFLRAQKKIRQSV